MSFPRYPEYKDSGLEWLGPVPGHWGSVRYKNVFDEKTSVAGISLPPGSISFGRVIFKDDEFLHEPTKASYQEVLSGEFLINPINLNFDLKSLRTAMSEIDTCVSPAYIVLKSKVASDKNYLKYQLQVFDLFHMKTLGAGVRQTITFGDIGVCFTCIPTLPEQTQIAAFLDREIAKIDALVAEQRRLLVLLKEKRQAVISHAVTRGLNPNAPMKPSGIEWLGDVPEHWEVSKLSRLVSTRKGIAFKADDFTDDGIAVVKASDIKEFTIRPSSTFLPLSFLAEYSNAILTNNEIVLSTVGSAAEVKNSAVGQLGLVPPELEGSLLNQNTVVFSPDETSLLNHFLFFILQTTAYRDHLDLHAHGTANQASLNVSAMLDFQIPLPNLAYQQIVINYLQTTLAKFNTLTTETQHAIDLLQERRTALISAAVTGQIDVRERSNG